MTTLKSLLERTDPIAPNTLCSSVLDRFADLPGRDLLAVVDGGKPVGVIARGSLRQADHSRRASEVMTPALLVDPDLPIEDARALLLAYSDPVPGLVAIHNRAYCGVVSARSILRIVPSDLTARGRQISFLELISREMRTPMNGVLAVSELLQRQPLSADSQAYVRTITESAQATLRALDDALELSQVDIEALTVEPSVVRLRGVMDAVQRAWQSKASQAGVTLLVAYDGEPELSALVDAARVQQVFDKLIEAAVSLNRRGSVEASLQAHRVGEGLRLVGRVRDTGGGLSADRLAGVFSEKWPGVATDLASAGLGLTLCRRVIERLGGTIRPETNVGSGATVVFELFADIGAAEAAPDDGAETTMTRAAHVLVVDDNATNRMVAEALCEMFDCTSECAEDGVEAVEAAQTGRFDLILMDIRMPRMDGVEATRAIRALPGRAGRVPIIALTANADPEDAKTYLANGMHSVVEKPIKPEKLLAAMSDALPEASQADAAAA
jgi:CheY-like chemotaxis protein/signal transduction histidine kinase